MLSGISERVLHNDCLSSCLATSPAVTTVIATFIKVSECFL